MPKCQQPWKWRPTCTQDGTSATLVVPFVWDTNACHRPSMDILNRKTLTVFNQYALNGILEGCAAVKWPYTTAIEETIVGTQPCSTSIYDFSGRILPHIPTKGLYIVNGKKYIR